MSLVADVSARFDGFELDVALSVADGETLVLVGENGAGKSTVLRLVAGLLRPETGRVILGSRVVFDHSARVDVPAWLRRVGYVPQDYLLFPHLSAFDNVAYGLRAERRPGGEIGKRVTAQLERFGMHGLAARRPAELSGGEQQRVALARALVLDPDVLLLDEPLAALDLRTRHSLRAELKRLLTGLSCSTVYVTHHPVEAIVFGDRIAALENGRVTQLGTRDELLRRPRSPYVAAFLGSNLFRGSIAGRDAGTARIRTPEGDISVVDPGGDEDVFAIVNPRDISLFREAPAGSARNCFRGIIAEIMPEPPHGERVRVALRTHPPLVAEVTDQAAASLGLHEGLEVYATFKATGIEVFR